MDLWFSFSFFISLTSLSRSQEKNTNKKTWSECSLTCGGGTQYKQDNMSISRYCNTISCPGDAGCLSAYLSFEHVIKNIIYDESHNGNLATMQGTAKIIDGGKFGKALNLTKDGNVTFDVVNFHNRPTLAITIAFWLKLSDVQGSHEIFFTCGTPSVYNLRAYHIGFDNGLVKWSQKDKDGNEIFSAVAKKPMEKRKWYHIAGTYRLSNGRASLYINGKMSMKANSTAPQQLPPSLNDNWTCADLGNPRDNRPLEGLIDEFYIFKCALLPEEIMELYTKNDVKRFGIPRPWEELTNRIWQKWISEEDISQK